MYFTNIFITLNCMGNKEYEVDVVHHVVENMDPDIKIQMESSYNAHVLVQAGDLLTQTKAVQVLLVTGIVNYTVKNHRSRSMEMRFFWITDQVKREFFDVQ